MCFETVKSCNDRLTIYSSMTNLSLSDRGGSRKLDINCPLGNWILIVLPSPELPPLLTNAQITLIMAETSN